MALLRSNRIVYLDRKGNVLSEEMIDAVVVAKRAVEAEACYAQLEAWHRTRPIIAPITRMTVDGKSPSGNTLPFGYCRDATRGHGRRHARWSNK